MQTIKVMSIIGFVIFVLSLICIITWGDTPDNDAALGWGNDWLSIWNYRF